MAAVRARHGFLDREADVARAIGDSFECSDERAAYLESLGLVEPAAIEPEPEAEAKAEQEAEPEAEAKAEQAARAPKKAPARKPQSTASRKKSGR